MAMAPSREERKQMRLRGAGNHKVKDVNFGFSFGSPTPQSPIPTPRSPSLSQKSPITPQSRHSTTSNKQLSIPSRASSRRSAASASAALPQDESIYDIPADDDRPEERSAKRRRISRSFESSVPESSPTTHRTNANPPPFLKALETIIHSQNSKQRRRKRKSVVQHPKKKRKSLLRPPVVAESNEVEAEEETQLQSPPEDQPSDAERDRSESHHSEDVNVPNEEPIDPPRDSSQPRLDAEADDIPEQEEEAEATINEPDISVEIPSDEGDPGPGPRSPTVEDQDTRTESIQAEEGPPTRQEVSQHKTSDPKPTRKRKKQNTDNPTKQKGKGRQQKDKGETRSTVPVLVHRLANTSALHELSDEADSTRSSPEDGRQPSPNETSSHHPQILSRSGVNAADVLSQICRETLEKTISTLESAIERESNRARQVEWTRKRKAVEAFGSELDGRLFEMSELLDSNFILAMRLKKEKKEVFTLRNQLMDLRKEREEIALRADEVRRRYSADENAKIEHGTINNALHDLQLAVDRSQKNAGKGSVDSTNPFVGLEFLLRTVSQDVCSSSSNFHGGLLSQVKAFNSQLERTAALLDRRGS
ncbi:AT hook domain-containing protein [Arthroderma uncinatum]|uniref:AT hook domain-containing protein n=1 Tax=Arthroderma uncinatum TaxID=74035 RepID=UPI00144AD502|nr:AT hook domain-containing protein [Arthroderma uncinatum]KAF3480627.1 AT hook domain-containing protein [Arthroderma uncinatum]